MLFRSYRAKCVRLLNEKKTVYVNHCGGGVWVEDLGHKSCFVESGRLWNMGMAKLSFNVLLIDYMSAFSFFYVFLFLILLFTFLEFPFGSFLVVLIVTLKFPICSFVFF